MHKLLLTCMVLVSMLGIIKITGAYSPIPERVVTEEFVPIAPQMDVTSYILIDTESRVVLAEYNADKYVNSPTLNKLLTTYTASQALARGEINPDIIKTEYTHPEGYNLISSARDKGHHLMAIIIGAKSPEARLEYSNILLNYGFNLYTYWKHQGIIRS